jgi:hypothetical protein
MHSGEANEVSQATHSSLLTTRQLSVLTSQADMLHTLVRDYLGDHIKSHTPMIQMLDYSPFAQC